MDLNQFLLYAGTVAGAGALDWGLITFYDTRVSPIPAKQKYLWSLALAVLIPGGALLVEVALRLATLTPESVFGVLVVGWLVSQGSYGTANAVKQAQAPAVPEVPK